MTERTAQPPLYPITALDRGLQIIATVRDEGRTRVYEIADQLGVAPSTAHRLLRTLVRGGYLEVTADHSYVPGRAMSTTPPIPMFADEMLARASTPMAELARRLGASTNLVVDGGPNIRVLYTVVVDGGTPDRAGSVLPTHLTAGGRALLSTLTEAEVWSRYPQCAADVPPTGFRGLVGTVLRARRAGFATAVSEIESGISAIGVPVRDPSSRAIAALTLSGRNKNPAFSARAMAHTAMTLRRTASLIGGSTGTGDRKNGTAG